MRARLCQGPAVGEERRDGFTPALTDHKGGKPGSSTTLISSPWASLGQRCRLALQRGTGAHQLGSIPYQHSHHPEAERDLLETELRVWGV